MADPDEPGKSKVESLRLWTLDFGLPFPAGLILFLIGLTV